MTKLCKFWVNTGRCRRAGCTARHGAPEERAAALAAWQLARRPAAVAGPAAAGGGSGGRQGKGQRAAVFAGKMRARSSTPSPLSGRLLSNTRRLAPSNERRQFRTPVSADWLVETYGQARLCSGSGVVEVAGGRGGLAFELCARRGIPCSLVRVASATTAVPAVLPPSCFAAGAVRTQPRRVEHSVHRGTGYALPEMACRLSSSKQQQQQHQQHQQQQQQVATQQCQHHC